MIRSAIYDALIVGLTAGWYRAVLADLPAGAHVLDVGIGTGAALLANAELLIERNIRITGVDIDADYIRRCRSEIERRRLSDRVEARLESIYDHRGGPYDAAYFSASFMLLPDPEGALRHIGTMLTPDAQVYFTQTFELRPSRWMETLKPLLRHLTTIDFGRVTYEADFRRVLGDAGVEIQRWQPLDSGTSRQSVLVMGRVGSEAARSAGAV